MHLSSFPFQLLRIPLEFCQKKMVGKVFLDLRKIWIEIPPNVDLQIKKKIEYIFDNWVSFETFFKS